MDKEKKSFLKKLWRHFLRRIVAGIIIIVPVGLTIFVLRWFFLLIDGILSPIISRYLKEHLTFFQNNFRGDVPGIGFILMLVLLYVLGLLSANLFGKRIILFFDKLFMKMPIVSFVYKIFKQLVDTVSGSKREAFQKVVLVSLIGSEVRVIGFVTGHSVDKHGSKFIHVFVPTSPNPTSGYLELLRPEQVIDTNLSVEEAIKIILSGGVITPERIG